MKGEKTDTVDAEISTSRVWAIQVCSDGVKARANSINRGNKSYWQ